MDGLSRRGGKGMIVEYHRPDTIDAALELLSRNDPVTVPLGGGTVLSRRTQVDYAVVDLQKLSLNSIEQQDEMLQIGATTTLEDMVQSEHVPLSLQMIAEREASFNLRQAATIGGMIAARDGRSPLLTALLAMDAQLLWLPGERLVNLGDWLPVRGDWKQGLIVQVRVPLQAQIAYEQVGRSPADIPIISVAAARWPSGRIRIVFGGDMALPVLAVDGPAGEETGQLAFNAYSHYRNQKYSKNYIQETTKALIRRLLD
jgi:putative selenate reductase FAD-binding subunit